MPTYAMAGAACGRPNFNAFGYIEHHRSNILTSASFTPPPRKSLWQILVEFLCKKVQP